MKNKKLVVCDLDGTLLDHKDRLKAFKPEDVTKASNWYQFHANHNMDSFYEHMVEMIQGYSVIYDIAFMTSRTDNFSATTHRQLGQVFYKPYRLLMRKSQDNSKPVDYKLEGLSWLLKEYTDSSIIFIDDDEKIIKAVNEIYPDITTLHVKN